MHVRHEVSQHRRGDAKRPHPIGQHAEHSYVKVLPNFGQALLPPARRLRAGRGASVHSHARHRAHPAGHERFEGEGQQRLDQHEDAEDLEGSGKTQRSHHFLQQHRESHGKQAAACGHHTVSQAQSLSKIMPQDHQRRLKRKRRSAAEQYSVCEVSESQRAEERGGTQEQRVKYQLLILV